MKVICSWRTGTGAFRERTYTVRTCLRLNAQRVVVLMLDFNTLAQQCAPNIHPTTLRAVVRTESSFNPYAIGVVGGHLARQPLTLREAIATVKALDAQGINFSVGLGQVNKSNFAIYGLNYETAFNLCANLKAGGNILHACYQRAVAAMGSGDVAIRAAISCYYSGNFTRGFKADFGSTSYVQRVAVNAPDTNPTLDVVPAIPVVMNRAVAKVITHPNAPTDTSNSYSEPTKRHPKWDAFGDYPCASDDECK